MSDLELACHTAAWNETGLINSLSDIERSGYRGIETGPEIVEQFEDRVTVFNEILTQHRMQLAAIASGGSKWPGMNLDEEVERGVNIARFLKTANAGVLVLYPPRPNPDSPLEDEMDLLPAATAYGEIARRTLEHGVVTCLHPEADSLVQDARTINKFIQMADPEAMKLCADIGFLAEAGIEARDFIKEHKKRLGIVHLKDIKNKNLKRTRKSKKEGLRPHAEELGKGDLKLEAFVEAVLNVNFSGWITVEFDAEPGRSCREIAAACHKYAEQHLDLVL